MTDLDPNVYLDAARARVDQRIAVGLVRPEWAEASAAAMTAEPGFCAAVESAYAAGRQAALDAGPCGDPMPSIWEGAEPILCGLRAGHIGWHQRGTTSWVRNAVGDEEVPDA